MTIELYHGDCLEVMQAARDHALETQKMTFDLIKSQNDRLLDITERLIDKNSGKAKKIVSPIGNSCHEIQHFANQQQFLTFDSADAEVIRSPELLELSEMQDYVCQIEAVSRINSTCSVVLPSGQRVASKVTDPCINEIGSIYTQALDQGFKVIISAKATIKNDEIHKLFIADAKKHDQS